MSRELEKIQRLFSTLFPRELDGSIENAISSLQKIKAIGEKSITLYWNDFEEFFEVTYEETETKEEYMFRVHGEAIAENKQRNRELLQLETLKAKYETSST